MTSGRDDRLYALTRWVATGLLAPGFRLAVHGIERIPLDRAYVLLPKHQRWQDIPLVGLSIPRPLYFVAKQELFTVAATDWLFKRLGGIPLNRQRPIESRRYLNRVVGVLKRGEGLVVFPEGTYYPGAVGPAKTGVVKFVLKRLALPFIPVGIRYDAGALRTRVTIRFGAPAEARPGEAVEAFVERIMTQIAILSGMGRTTESALPF
jgi:1-acyl-sn-glycerol-3-phosphate acyltransferase